jgi:hypothetical protein
MEEKAKGQSKLVGIITAVLSLVSAVGVAFIGYRVEQDKLALEQARVALEQADMEIKAELDRISVSIGQETLALEQRRFEAEQRSRWDNVITEYVPKLLSPSEADRQVAVAILFVIYPNDARDILSKVAEALDEEQVEALKPLIEQAESLDEKTGEWAVAISSDLALEGEGARYEVDVSREQGYDAVIYRRGDWYVTTIGPFPTKVEAERAKFVVQSEFPGGSYRESAYVINLNSWCPRPVPIDDVLYECQGQ